MSLRHLRLQAPHLNLKESLKTMSVRTGGPFRNLGRFSEGKFFDEIWLHLAFSRLYLDTSIKLHKRSIFLNYSFRTASTSLWSKSYVLDHKSRFLVCTNLSVYSAGFRFFKDNCSWKLFPKTIFWRQTPLFCEVESLIFVALNVLVRYEIHYFYPREETSMHASSRESVLYRYEAMVTSDRAVIRWALAVRNVVVLDRILTVWNISIFDFIRVSVGFFLHLPS